MSTANDIQIGGDHYKSKYQHWDWVIDVHLGYLEAQISRYIDRWPKKNGLQDLNKAYHYAIKLKESYLEGRYDNISTVNERMRHYNTRIFVDENELGVIETSIMYAVVGWKDDSDIDEIIRCIQSLIDNAAQGVPAKAATGGSGRKLDASEQAGGTTTQAAASSGISEPHNTAIEGMEHPFGYEGDE